MTRAPAAAAALAALALTACGGDEKRLLAMGPVERGIERGIEADRPGTDVVEVDCPEGVELRKGEVFQCEVRGSRQGEFAIATVTQVDDRGRVRYRVP
ncbi:MAG TPA: DUF4333 domain-containing protein [Thermoleophilaceae bacterium]